MVEKAIIHRLNIIIVLLLGILALLLRSVLSPLLFGGIGLVLFVVLLIALGGGSPVDNW